ncbi:OsmC family peroxiredoxin [bacterium]|nr:MAG: OsmC family peroxiredoxin [bacterium]
MASSNIVFVKGMQFVGTSDSGHAVVMDAPESVGGSDSGQTPMEFLLTAFGGCSGMDVISILRKKRQNVKGLTIEVKGEKAETHPKVYTTIHIDYTISGEDVSEEAVKRAVDLSLERYCSVGSMLGKAAKITHSYKIVEK